MDIGKAKVTAIESIGQSLMIDSTEVQNRGMKVVKMTRILHRPITKRIGFAIMNTTSHSTPDEPSGEGVQIMVTTPASLGSGGSPKLATTHHQVGIQQTTLLEVGQECCDSLIRLQGKLAVVRCNIGVPVPTLRITSRWKLRAFQWLQRPKLFRHRLATQDDEKQNNFPKRHGRHCRPPTPHARHYFSIRLGKRGVDSCSRRRRR